MLADLSRPVPSAASPVQFAQPAPQAPLELISLNVRFITRGSVPGGAVQLDDLQVSSQPALPPLLTADRMVIDPSRSSQPLGLATVLSGFDGAEQWSPLQGFLSDRMQDEVRGVPSATGGQALELRWRPQQGQPATHGLQPRTEERPVSVVASQGFLEKTNAKVGDTLRAFVNGTFIDLRVDGSFRLFPTLADPRKEASVVANGSRLAQAVNANPRSAVTYADEVWLRGGEAGLPLLKEDLNSGVLGATLTSFAELRTAQQKDPLIAAGWEGILFISFAAILMLSAIGFLIYSYLTAQKRTLEFAVLRTMGFSKLQIATVVGFEQAFVIGLGMIAGTLMGLRLGSLMIRYMGVTETGDEVLPPLLLHVSWFTAGSALLVLGTVFLVTIGIVVLLYSRLALHRVLRIGEA